MNKLREQYEKETGEPSRMLLRKRDTPEIVGASTNDYVEWLEKKLERVMGICGQCGHKIRYNGAYWVHLGKTPRHIAEPREIGQ